MKKIGITGGIASGKTTLLSIFKKKGFKVFSADILVKDLYKENKKGYKELKKLKLDIFKNNKIDIKKLRTLFLKDKKVKIKIEEKIHPLVIKEIIKILKKHKNVVVEIPLLFESKLEKLFTHIITTRTSNKKALPRIMKRGLSEKEAKNMIKIRGKVKKSKYDIKNNTTLASFKKTAKKTIEKILKN
jgi:dephospho-CoA kinase